MLSALAWDAASLIAFRVLQGVGGGILMPMMSTLVMQAAGGKGLARIMAVIGIPASLGPILGPVLGGVVLDRLDWRWLFLVTLLRDGGHRPRAEVPAQGRGDPPREARRHRVRPHVLKPGGRAVRAERRQQGRRVPAPGRARPLLAGLAAIGVFTRRALRRRTESLVDLRLLRHLPLASSTLLLFLSGVALYGAMLLIPLYFQQLRGMTPLVAGLLLIPQGVGTLLSRTPAARLSETIGSRWVVVAGFVLVTIGTVPFLGATEHTDLVLISAFLLVRGLGLGAVTVTLMALAFEGLARDEVPHASVISRIGQQLGGSFGTAVLAVTLQAATTTASTPALGFQHAFWWALGFTLLAVLVSFTVPAAAAHAADAAGGSRGERHEVPWWPAHPGLPARPLTPGRPRPETRVLPRVKGTRCVPPWGSWGPGRPG